MKVFMFVAIAAAICTLFILLTRFFIWLSSENHRREEIRRKAIDDLGKLQFPQSGFECREQLVQEVQSIQSAGEIAVRLEERARQAAFPIPPSLPSWESRDATVTRFVAFVTAAPFAVAAGAGEQFFYSLFDGLKETPFAETLSFLTDYTGQQLAVGLHEAGELASPAVHQLWHLLISYYHDHPIEAVKLFVHTFDAITIHTQEQVFDLLKHAFDVGHLHVYGEALAPVIHPIAESLSHSAAVAHEHLGHLDIHSLAVPHDAAVPHFHFPFITIALSATREIRLLAEEKTSIGNSLKNASLDVAGTSVGGFGGAKAGAFIGTFFAPGIGTAIGGAIGGLLGAFTGRLATNAVKESDLKRATAIYEQKFSAMESETTTGAHNLYSSASAAMTRGQQAYLRAIGHMQSLSEAALPLGPDVETIAESMRVEFGRCRATLLQAYQRSLALVPSDSWYHYLFGGAGAEQTKAQLLAIYNAKEKRLKFAESKIPTNAACTTEPLSSLKQLASLEFPRSHEYESQLIGTVQKVRLTKASYLSNLLVWARTATHHYQEAMKNTQVSISTEAERFKTLCEQWRKDVQVAVEDVKVEQAKLGRA